MKTGLELLITLQLALEIMDEYKLNGLTKRRANLFKESIEKDIVNSYNKNYSEDMQMITNSMNLKHRLVSQLAELDEAEAMVFSEYANKFFENKDEYLKSIEVNIHEIK